MIFIFSGVQIGTFLAEKLQTEPSGEPHSAELLHQLDGMLFVEPLAGRQQHHRQLFRPIRRPRNALRQRPGRYDNRGGHSGVRKRRFRVLLGGQRGGIRGTSEGLRRRVHRR